MDYKIYKVGGCVRDAFLGRKQHDIDYCVVGADVETMLSEGYKQVGNDFPVFLKNGKEYALARKEISTGKGHRDFQFEFGPEVTLEEDLVRRDFTINAICEDTETGEIIDLFNGISDLKKKVIRHIDSEYFVQDPLRLLRGCRFAAQLNFEIAEETKRLFIKMVKDDMLQHLTPERVWGELAKALNSVYFYKFIENLQMCNALEIILPELYALKGIPENYVHHPEGDAFEHVMLCLKQVPAQSKQSLGVPISDINFGILCHDLGKAVTNKETWPAHHNHEELGVDVVRSLCYRLCAPNTYLSVGRHAARYHMYFYKFDTMSVKKKYDFIDDVTNFKNDYYLRMLVAINRCDVLGRAKPVKELASKLQEAEIVHTEMNKIFNILYNVNVAQLPSNIREHLSKFSGTTFGKLLRDAKISYLKKYLLKGT